MIRKASNKKTCTILRHYAYNMWVKFFVEISFIVFFIHNVILTQFYYYKNDEFVCYRLINLTHTF